MKPGDLVRTNVEVAMVARSDGEAIAYIHRYHAKLPAETLFIFVRDVERPDPLANTAWVRGIVSGLEASIPYKYLEELTDGKEAEANEA